MRRRVLSLLLPLGVAAQSCNGTTKQPALYAHWNFSTPLSEAPAYALNITVAFTGTGSIPAASGGVFLSHMLRWRPSASGRAFGGGYTGMQSYGPSLPGGQLFSVWDGEDAAGRPLLAWPAAPNCARHLNDGRAMGCQCPTNLTFPDGHRVRWHVRRTAVNASLQVNATFSVRGDVWASTATDETADAPPLEVGAVLLEGGWGGVAEFSAFFEHVSCVPCAAWPASAAVVGGPSFEGRDATAAFATINGFATSACRAQTVTACLDGVGCGAPIVHFLTGPGVVRNISDGQEIWGPPAAARAAAAAAAAPPPPSTRFGAIRWDAFYNSTPCVGAAAAADAGCVTARVLQPERWAGRRPWYTATTPGGNITFDGCAPAVIAEEIRAAAAAGLDHWVFDVYPEELPLSCALLAYLNATAAAPAAAPLRFALLLQASWAAAGGAAAWPAKAALYARHFADARYATVLGSRPLVHLFSLGEDDWGPGSGWRAWAAALGALRSAALAAGRGAPYFVLQTWHAGDGAAAAAAINAAAAAAAAGARAPPPPPLVAALSSYAVLGATEAGTPWPTFAAGMRAWWGELAATGMQVVPVVAAGWDPRPRVDTPPPWAPHQDPAFVEMPTPAQLGAAVADALAWQAANAASNVANVGLLSAWNEYDEGHWIAPTLGAFGGDERLRAIAAVLNPQ